MLDDAKTQTGTMKLSGHPGAIRLADRPGRGAWWGREGGPGPVGLAADPGPRPASDSASTGDHLAVGVDQRGCRCTPRAFKLRLDRGPVADDEDEAGRLGSTTSAIARRTCVVGRGPDLGQVRCRGSRAGGLNVGDARPGRPAMLGRDRRTTRGRCGSPHPSRWRSPRGLSGPGLGQGVEFAEDLLERLGRHVGPDRGVGLPDAPSPLVVEVRAAAVAV